MWKFSGSVSENTFSSDWHPRWCTKMTTAMNTPRAARKAVSAARGAAVHPAAAGHLRGNRSRTPSQSSGSHHRHFGIQLHTTLLEPIWSYCCSGDPVRLSRLSQLLVQNTSLSRGGSKRSGAGLGEGWDRAEVHSEQSSFYVRLWVNLVLAVSLHSF